MAHIDGPDLNVFQNLVKGVQNFNEEELARVHKAAEEVKAAMKSADDREQKRMAAFQN